MMITKSLTQLMEKEVSRKEFLLYFGLALVTIIGISSFFNRLNSLSQPKAEKGFGSKPYGM